MKIFKPNNKVAGWLFVAVLVAVVGGLLLANKAAVIRLANDWGLIPRPERYTELYFTDYKQLAHLKAGQTQKLAFTVFNNEHQITTYHITLNAKSADGSQAITLSSLDAVIPPNQSRQVTKEVELPKFDARTSVEVSMTYWGIAFGENAPSKQSQTIHYWLNSLGDTGRGSSYGS